MRVKTRVIRVTVTSLLAILFLSCGDSAKVFDLVISDVVIVDGTGNPWYRGDVGIRQGMISRIGSLADSKSKRVINASGLVVSPGFIDMHTHTERKMLDFPDVENYIRQGVTTVVGGNCGSSPHPVGDFFADVNRTGVSLNLALLVGHNTIRKEVMGTENPAAILIYRLTR